ncbi:MAG: hypothetical protein Q8942_18270, partial [Bacillota bacterium]|nr:hypothetical protein [Bacillota bacterium]
MKSFICYIVTTVIIVFVTILMLSTDTSASTASLNYLSEIKLPDNCQISDTVLNPSKPLIYAVDTANSKVYAVNYNSGSVNEVSLNYMPEKITIFNNELFVTLVMRKHSSGWDTEDQYGGIAILDADNMSINDEFDINLDPYDIDVDENGNIFVSSGSGQWTSLKSYSTITKQELSSSNTAYEMSGIAYNKQLKKLYAQHLSSEVFSYNISNGKIYLYSLPEDIFPATNNFKVSPDGKFIFFSSGNVFKCDPDTKKEGFYVSLDKSFNDITFDIDNNKFYTATDNKKIYVYDYDTKIGASILDCKDTIQYIYFKDNEIIALAINDDNKTVIEKININEQTFKPTSTQTPQPTPSESCTITPTINTNTPSPTTEDWNYIINDSVMDTNKPVIYFTDSTNNVMASYNYKTNFLNKVQLIYSPSCVDYYDNKLFIGYGQNGIIGIYDSSTMQLENTIIVGMKFNDLAVGRDGNVYVTGLYDIKEFSLSSLNEIGSTFYVQGQLGNIVMNPTKDYFYFSDSDSSSVVKCIYNKGKVDLGWGGAHPSCSKLRISPDGNYAIDDKGNIFIASICSRYDMKQIRPLSNCNLSDVCFDLQKDSIYCASKDTPSIKCYNYSTFSQYGAIKLKNIPFSICSRDGNIISLSGNGVEIVSEESYISQNPTLTPSTGIMQPENSAISDVVCHKNKPFIYTVDPAGYRILLNNTETGEQKIKRVEEIPEQLAIYGNELFVGSPDLGKINVYDAEALDFKYFINTNKFSNFVIGNNGYIYTSPQLDDIYNSYIRCYSIISRQEINCPSVKLYGSSGSICSNPRLNILYILNSSYLYSDYIIINNAQYDSSYKRKNFISANGKYLINSYGDIYLSSEDKTKDLKFVCNIGLDEIKDACFDPVKDCFYVIDGTNTLYVFDSNSYNRLYTCDLKADAERIIFSGFNLMALFKNSDNVYYIENLSEQLDTRPNDIIIPRN